MKMIVLKSTFQDEESGMDIRGLGKADCRTLTGAGLCFKTVTRKLVLFCFFNFWGVGGVASFCEFSGCFRRTIHNR